MANADGGPQAAVAASPPLPLTHHRRHRRLQPGRLPSLRRVSTAIAITTRMASTSRLGDKVWASFASRRGSQVDLSSQTLSLSGPRSHLFPLPSPPTSFPPLGGPAQSDSEGHGVVAQRPLSAGETLVDWSVFFITRPPDYALAHLPQFHALEFGHESYFLLREPMLGHCSLTYYVNEARHGGADGPPPNVAYKVVRPKDGGVALALLVLAPIDEGVELLASYDQKLAHAFR